jgi:hypothetical protein
MEVQYDLTPEDLRTFQRYHAKHPLLPQKKNLAGIFMLVGVGAVAFLAMIAYPFLRSSFMYSPYAFAPYAPAMYQLLEMIPGVGLGVLLGFTFYPMFLRFLTRGVTRQALQEGRNEEKTMGWRRLNIDPHAIRMTSAFSTNANYWEGIDAVVATPDYVYIYVTTRSAHVVPRRAFPNDRAFDEFVEMARRYRQIGRLGEGRREPPDEDRDWAPPRPPAVDPPPLPADVAAEGVVAKERTGEKAMPGPEEEPGPVA